MADGVERASIADVERESDVDEQPIDIDVGLLGVGATEAIVADLDGESLREGDQQAVDDDGAPTRAVDVGSSVEPIGGYRAEWNPSGGEDEVFDSNDLLAHSNADAGLQPIGGYRAEWHPSDSESATFDPTDLRASPDLSFGEGAIDSDASSSTGATRADASFGEGATDVQLRIADDVKYSDDADQPADGPHEVDIGGNLDEPTEVWIEPAEPSDGAVTEVSDTDAPSAATDGANFEDVD